MLLRELLVGNLLDVAAALLVIVGTLAAMLWMDWKLTLLSLAIVQQIMALHGGSMHVDLHDLALRGSGATAVLYIASDGE